MNFKDTAEISVQMSKIFESIKSLPLIACSGCGTLYRSEEREEGFVCVSCKELQAHEREEKRKREYHIQTLLHLSNIPKRYKSATFKPKTAIQEEVANYFTLNFTKRILDKSSDILLFGSIGTGKTYLSCAFAIDLINKRENRVKYITEYELLSIYFKKKYQEFENFRNTDILILDEIGKRVLSDWQRIQLEELLSYRYNELLPTIYITNLEQEGFRKFLGDRLTDRLRENKLRRFAFNGQSLRG